MAIAKKDLRKCLTEKFGFTPVPGTKHDAVSLIIEGRKVATTRFSRSHVTLSDSILTLLSRQLWVQTQELKKIEGCTISRDEYLAKLRERGHLT